MGDWPGDLQTVSWTRATVKFEDIEKQRVQEEFRKELRREIQELDLKTSAFDLDAQLWLAGPDDLSKLVNDESLSEERRAKVLEVVLLRGSSSESMDYMAAIEEIRAKGGHDSYYGDTIAYQAAATVAVLNSGGALFKQLSRSADQLPSGRSPATEWMNVTLRDGGVMASYENRQQVEKWIVGLDPGVRGMAMYHLADAASTSGIDEGKRLTGVSGGIGPIEAGLQWENAKDTHWQKVGRDIETKVTHELKLHPEQKAAFYEGLTHADSHLENPRDYYTPPRQ